MQAQTAQFLTIMKAALFLLALASASAAPEAR